MNSDQEVNLNIILVGEASVGKSALTEKYISGKFDHKTKPTVGTDFVKRSIVLNDVPLNVRFWDTAGQEKYRAMVSKFYQKANGAFVVYDVTNKQSFELLEYWIKSIRESSPENMPIMLIGNKNDLIEERQISTEQGVDFSKKLGLFFFETSAKDDSKEKIETAFSKLITEASLIAIENNKKREEIGMNKAKGEMITIEPPKSKEKNCC